MAKYIDSANEQKIEYVRAWLDDNVVSGIRSFRTQSGYYSWNAVLPFEKILSGVARSGHLVAFVLGANDGQLDAGDLQKTLGIIQQHPCCRLTVVSFTNAEFHPKTYHITRSDNSETALIGSGNFTSNGISLNVEAAIILDSSQGDDPLLLKRVADAIDTWATATEDEGAYQVVSQKDIDDLKASDIIGVPTVRQHPGGKTPGAKNGGKSVTKSRIHIWKTPYSKPSPPGTSQTPPSTVQYNGVPVLIAEIPNAGSRWRQANFDKQAFELFFGLTIGDKKHKVTLQHVSTDGSLSSKEIRQGVSVKSRNFRLELGAASGAYPKDAAPIAVFVKVGSGSFRYRLLMPNDSEFQVISSFLKANWSGRSDRKRRVITDSAQLRASWPNSPLWRNAGTLF